MSAQNDIQRSNDLLSLLSDDGIPLSDIVQEFTHPVNEAVKAGGYDGLESHLWSVWNLLITAAAHTPHTDQERLVKLVQEIQQLPGPKQENGKGCTIWGEPLEWKSLPIFGPSMRKAWDDSPENLSETLTRWPNINAFAARLTSISQPGGVLDFSLYGIWTLRSTLEDRTSGEETARDASIRAAVMWIIYAADTLWQRCCDEQSFDGRMATEGNTLNGKNWKGFNKERWRIWFARFVQARDICSNDMTIEFIQQAGEKMGEVEKHSSSQVPVS